MRLRPVCTGTMDFKVYFYEGIKAGNTLVHLENTSFPLKTLREQPDRNTLSGCSYFSYRTDSQIPPSFIDRLPFRSPWRLVKNELNANPRRARLISLWIARWQLRLSQKTYRVPLETSYRLIHFCFRDAGFLWTPRSTSTKINSPVVESTATISGIKVLLLGNWISYACALIKYPASTSHSAAWIFKIVCSGVAWHWINLSYSFFSGSRPVNPR